MIRFLTAGESHGKALAVILEGMPAGCTVNSNYINRQLRRRQMGYGRGPRMKTERDAVEILSGIRNGKTLGSPIAMLIQNKDWEHWKDILPIEQVETPAEPVTIPRPGHADLNGYLKYGFDDIRNSIERSSARETAARVAAASIVRYFLSTFGISFGSYVESIGGIFPQNPYSQRLFTHTLPADFSAEMLALQADESDVRVLETQQEALIIEKIKTAKKHGDTLGGTFFALASGVPPGLGSFMHYDRRLDAAVSSAIMSIPAVKAVSFGLGFEAAAAFGSEVHDPITISENGYSRSTNKAGGIEGGISTGLPIIVRAAMKPIATLMHPLQSVDTASRTPVLSRRERSDFVAVPACSVIAEAMLAWVIAEAFFEKFGGDSCKEVQSNYTNYMQSLHPSTSGCASPEQ